MHLLARAAITLTVAAFGTAGLTSTAYAEKVVHNDTPADVLTITWDGETEADPVPAPEATDGDILRTAVDHRLRKVILIVKYTELRRVDPVMHFVSLVTNESLRRDVVVTPDADHPQGKVIFAKGSGTRLRCAGLERRIDYTANTLRLEIPRSCLSAPRWVRVGVGAVRTHETGPESGETFIDDANRNGALGSAHPAFGARVRRG
jgi:hypothetical protein